ncbi:MAG TPA: hypothetical protein VGH19_01375 [Verrucomicrobiae bacterium]
MRFTWVVVLLAVVLSSGCASKSKQVEEKSPFMDRTSDVAVSAAPPAEKSTRKNKDDGKPEIAPANAIAGKVVMVNDALRYVVVDFGFGRLPQPEQRLGVYRAGNKVAEIKISSQPRNSNYAADIITGTIAIGDEVRQ